MSELTKQDLKRLRESEFYKFNNQSDFKTLRKCYEVSKELYECLKYFDKRSSRFSVVSQNQVFYTYKRSRIYPEEYFKFQFQSDIIGLYKSGNNYFVGVQGKFRPVTMGDECFTTDLSTFHRYCLTDLFSEAMDCFLKVVSEYIAQRFDNRGLF